MADRERAFWWIPRRTGILIRLSGHPLRLLALKQTF